MRKIPIRYVGTHTSFSDHLYESGATWEFGEVVQVALDKAMKLLKHPEFEDARTAKEQAKHTLKDLLALEEKELPPEIDEDQERLEQEPPLVQLESLTKEQIVQYAQRNFGVVLDTSAKKADLIDTVRRQMGRRVS